MVNSFVAFKQLGRIKNSPAQVTAMLPGLLRACSCRRHDNYYYPICSHALLRVIWLAKALILAPPSKDPSCTDALHPFGPRINHVGREDDDDDDVW
jgi:hypothetical protein